MSRDAARWVDVVAAADVAPGQVRPFEVDGRELLICRAGENYYAVENQCSHTGALMTRARIRGECIVCPVHGARFQLKDGRHLTPPATTGLRTFAVRVVDGRVQIVPDPIPPPGGAADPNAFRA